MQTVVFSILYLLPLSPGGFGLFWGCFGQWGQRKWDETTENPLQKEKINKKSGLNPVETITKEGRKVK